MDTAQSFYEYGSVLRGEQLLIAADVGAANGLLVHWHKLFGQSHILFFEPHPDSYQALVDSYQSHPCRSQMHFFDCALGSRNERREFFMSNAPTGSSFYEPDHAADDVAGNAYFYPLRKGVVETKRLSDVLNTLNSRVDLIKMDVQGAELEILHGISDDHFKQLLLVEAEVNLKATADEGTTLAGIDSFLKDRNYQILDIKVNRSPRYITGEGVSYQERYLNVANNAVSVAQMAYEFDMVYVQSPQAIVSQGDESLLRRYLFCLCMYNFFGDALYTLDIAVKQGVIDVEWQTQVQRIISNIHNNYAQAIKPLDDVVRALNGMNYSQYMWQPFPSS
jgi:FkbM family methyltransferase